MSMAIVVAIRMAVSVVTPLLMAMIARLVPGVSWISLVSILNYDLATRIASNHK